VAKQPRLRIELPHFLPPVPSPSLSLHDAERTHILRVLERTAGRIRGEGGAASILKIKPTTLESRMARLGIKPRGRKARHEPPK
jgi:transcriptional regulator with GAF, ATPase, and Fis domain